MFINHDIVPIIFKLANFIGLIILASYIFKKYVATDVNNAITSQIAEQHALENQHLSLEKEQNALDLRLKEEFLTAETLRNKIDEWRKTIATEHVHHEKQHAEHAMIMTAKLKQRAAQQEQDHIKNMVINEVLPQVQESLSNHFSNEDNNAHYLNSIIHFMNERI